MATVRKRVVIEIDAAAEIAALKAAISRVAAANSLDELAAAYQWKTPPLEQLRKKLLNSLRWRVEQLEKLLSDGVSTAASISPEDGDD
ncbi:MAG: hypothetical protein KatS3mg054_0163 [Chloroflexus sp.]|nr:MAG: hypothetical protein KatS3mg054_0163 [Chloroflexus sp.]